MKVFIFDKCSVTIKKTVQLGPKLIEATVEELTGQEFKVQRADPEMFTCPLCGQEFLSISVKPVKADHTCPNPLPRPGQRIISTATVEPEPQPALVEERAVPVATDTRRLPSFKDKRKKR